MRQADVSTVNLPEHRVDVVEPGTRSRRHWRKCEIGENLKFDTAGLESYCLASWDTRVFDAFVLAGAVQFCDHTKARPSAGWGRDFRLRLPVHEPALWRSATVSEALHGTLEFLTGDRWQIEFTERQQPAPSPKQGQFNMPDVSRIIVPFSDGLDSFVVSGLMERQHRHRLIRVRLGSKSLNGSRMGSLQVPFALVPYRMRFGKRGSLETSARSRGFRFALLSGLAAYLSQARQVIMTESGQGALGPTLVPVGQAYEDYRSHPRFTNRMEALLSALFDHEIRYDYPRLWHTKAETIAEFIADFPGNDDWARTRSCWQGARQVSVSRQKRQCGTCAACMLRRMSVYAIGRAEKEDTYVWEDLSAPRYEEGAASAFENNRPNGALYEYAIAGALHLDHLAGLLLSSPNKVLLDRNVFQLSRSLDLPEGETRRKLERLLTQHGNEWKNFVHSLGPQSFVAQWALGGHEMSLEKSNGIEIGERLRVARQDAGVTQAQAAMGIDIARTTLVAIEKGQRRVRIDELRRLARIYNTSVNALLRRESVYVDLVPRFRKLGTNTDEAGDAAARLLADLVRAEVELENHLGIKRTPNYPPERPIMLGDVRAQAESDATELRQWLGLGMAPVRDLVSLLELDLGVRVFMRRLNPRISGLFAYDDKLGACMLFNANHPRERRTQTAAHEVGHFMSTRRTAEILHTDEDENSRAERYANIFGRAFLTPARTVMHRFREITAGSSQLTRRHVILLAHAFGVSREALVRRLEELGLTKVGTWDWIQANGGIADDQARQVLGDLVGVDTDKIEADHPTTLRLNLLAAEAWRQELLSEGQLARLLNLDRLRVREILDNVEIEGSEADGMPKLSE